MIYEKSCGAVVFRDAVLEDGKKQKYVLMIKHSKNSNHSFPKGHVEEGESERQTAVREVFEETAVKIEIKLGFRHPVFYRPRPGVKKEVVYFLALTAQEETEPLEGETVLAKWIPVEEASELLAYDNDRRVLSHALAYLEAKGSKVRPK